MNNVLLKFGALVLRVSFGAAMFAFHGIGKAGAVISGKIGEFPDPIGLGSAASFYLAAAAEAICPIMIVLGLFTRFASAALAFNMAVALWWCISTHAPAELAALYLAAFASIALIGSGAYSIDGALAERSKK